MKDTEVSVSATEEAFGWNILKCRPVEMKNILGEGGGWEFIEKSQSTWVAD